MGLKRPYDDEFPELSFKQSRRGENGDRVSAFVDKEQNISGEFGEGFQKPHWCNIHVDEAGDDEFETSAPFSWITSSSSEDDPGMGSSRSPEVASFEDVYSSCSPRKQVPLGLNHQAAIPPFVGKIRNGSSDSYEERVMGTTIIPMPDSSSPSPIDDNVGAGHRDCTCLDSGSLRCVQQHIMEARENLRDVLGQEKHVGLGLNDIGEELAKKWSEEEEHLFHEVVYTSRNFWNELSLVFPSRTKPEIVSYYFNVFILRRRATQNRSRLLDIDSDNDEWHESIGETRNDKGDVFGYENQNNSFHVGAGDELSRVFFMDDSRSWDVRFPSDLGKEFEFLPTCNMIEEIFGQQENGMISRGERK